MLFRICNEKLASASGHLTIDSRLPAEIRLITGLSPSQGTGVPAQFLLKRSSVVLFSNGSDYLIARIFIF